MSDRHPMGSRNIMLCYQQNSKLLVKIRNKMSSVCHKIHIIWELWCKKVRRHELLDVYLHSGKCSIHLMKIMGTWNIMNGRHL